MKLTSYPFLDNIEPDALAFLENHIKPVSIPKNTILFYQGDICETILWLTQGEVRLYTQSDTIEDITLYSLKAGEQCIVNTASSISDTDAIATAESITNIEGYIIDKESIKKLSALSPVYQRYIFSLYTIRMADLAMLINDIKFKKLDVRLLEWLQKNSETNIKMTHEEIANSLGSSRVVISRTLKELEKRGKVKLYRGSVEVL